MFMRVFLTGINNYETTKCIVECKPLWVMLQQQNGFIYINKLGRRIISLGKIGSVPKKKLAHKDSRAHIHWPMKDKRSNKRSHLLSVFFSIELG